MQNPHINALIKSKSIQDDNFKLVSIIIVSWNTKDLLIGTLKSIENELVNFENEIWVIDNSSKDGSVDAVRRQFPEVKIIENIQNVGFGKANNQGIEVSSGKYILFLNSDTEVYPGAIQMLIKFLETHPNAGGVGPKLLNEDKSLQDSCYPFPNLFREFWRLFYLDVIKPFGVYDQKNWDAETPREVDALKGACILFRRDVLNQSGYFDVDFFMYTEEIDLCFRVKQKGWKLFWLPPAQVLHFGGQSTNQIPGKMFESLYRTKIMFFRKHYGRFSASIYKLIIFLASILRVMGFPLVYLEPRNRRKEYSALVKNYLRLVISIGKM